MKPLPLKLCKRLKEAGFKQNTQKEYIKIKRDEIWKLKKAVLDNNYNEIL